MDAVSDIIAIDPLTIQETPPEKEKSRQNAFIEGLVQNNEQMVMLLDPKSLIDHDLADQLEAVEEDLAEAS